VNAVVALGTMEAALGTMEAALGTVLAGAVARSPAT
jgi:hypothetical protein